MPFIIDLKKIKKTINYEHCYVLGQKNQKIQKDLKFLIVFLMNGLSFWKSKKWWSFVKIFLIFIIFKFSGKLTVR